MRKLLLVGLPVLALLCLSQSKTLAQDNVGIGTTNPRPTALLDLFSSDKGLLLPRVDTNDIYLGLGVFDNGMMVYDTVVGDLYVWDGTRFVSLTPVGDTARWGVSGNDIYSLNSGGVGIGINTPAQNLHIHNASGGSALILTSSGTGATGSDGLVIVESAAGVGIIMNQENQPIQFGTNGANNMVLDERGRVGIGTTSPGEMFVVSADSNDGFVSIMAENTNANGISSFDLVNDVNRFELRYDGSTKGGDFFLYDDNAGVARMVINPTGYVGIGDWNPDTQLDVTDSLAGNFVSLEIENKHATGAAALNLWNDNTAYAIGVDGSSAGSGLDDKFYIFNSPAGEFSVVIDDAGNVGIGNVTSPLVQLHVDGDGLFNGFIGLSNLGVAPGVTNNRLYNVGGGLFWDGNPLLTAADTAIWITDGTDIWSKPVTGGIGINTSSLNVNYSTTLQNNGRLGGLRIENIYNGASPKYGLFINLSNAGTGDKYGNYVNLLGTSGSGSALYGTYNFMSPSGATGVVYGAYNRVLSSGSGQRYGTYNDVTGAASNTSQIFGERNVVQHLGTGDAYGELSIVSGSSNGNMYAEYAQISTSGSGSNYGQYVNMANTGTAIQYGLYVSQSGSGSGTEYGVFTAGEDYNYFSGNVGIGNSSPQEALHISGGTIRLGDYAGNGRNLLTINNNGDVGYVNLSDSILWTNLDGTNINNNNSGAVIIGTDSIDNGKLQIVTQANENSINAWRYTSNNAPVNFRGLKSRGTEAVPSAVQNNDYLFGLSAAGYDGTSYTSSGRILFRAGENFNSTDHGTGILFETAGLGSVSPSTRMVISPDGDVGIGTPTPVNRLAVYDNTSLATTSIIANEVTGLNATLAGTKALRVSVYDDIASPNAVAAIEARVGGSGTATQTGVLGYAEGSGTLNYNRGLAGVASNNTATNIGVDAYATGNTGINYGIRSFTAGTQTSSKYGIFNDVTGNGTLYGLYNDFDVSATNTTTNYGIYNLIRPNGTGQVRGLYQIFTAVGSGIRYGMYNLMQVNAANNSSIFGARNDIDQDGGGNAYGYYANLYGSGTANTYAFYGSNSNGGTGDYGIYMTNEERNYLTGNLGIGNNNPLDRLYVQSTTTGEGVTINNNAADGDPVLTFATNGVDNWSMGIDDSDGDAFKIGRATIGTSTIINIETTGNVGIGTTAPTTGYRTHVSSDLLGGSYVDLTYTGASTQYGLFVNSANTGTGVKYGYYLNLDGTAGDASSIYGQRLIVDPFGTGTSYGSLVNMSAQGTGIRYGYFANMIHASGNTSAVYGFRSDIDQDGSGAAYGIYSRLDGSGTGTTYAAFLNNVNAGSGDYGIYTTGEERNYIENTLGLGTSTPTSTYQLHVAGGTTDLRAVHANNTYTGSSQHYGLFSWMSGAGTGNAIGLYISNSSTTSGVEYGVYSTGEDRNYFAGSMGFGTTNPQNRLDVEGSAVIGAARSGSTAAPANGLLVQGFVGMGDVTTPAQPLHVQDNRSGNRVAFFHNTNTGTTADGIAIRLENTSSSNDYVYFERTSGLVQGRIAGNGSGSVSYLTSSDRRLKTNISKFEGGLDMVLKMKPKNYVFKSSPDIDRVGFIAQELDDIFPEAVSGDSALSVDEEPMMVDYSKLTPVLTSSVQELHQIIMDQQKLINSQKAEISGLKNNQGNFEAQLDAMKTQIQMILENGSEVEMNGSAEEPGN